MRPTDLWFVKQMYFTKCNLYYYLCLILIKFTLPFLFDKLNKKKYHYLCSDGLTFLLLYFNTIIILEIHMSKEKFGSFNWKKETALQNIPLTLINQEPFFLNFIWIWYNLAFLCVLVVKYVYCSYSLSELTDYKLQVTDYIVLILV